MNTSPTEPIPPAIPPARIAPERGVSWAWLLPLLALLFAGYVVFQTWGERGPLVGVRAKDGYGIQTGDPLRYRGIRVGEIEAVELDRDLSSVVLSVRLDPGAEGIAREGSRFWLVRPQLSLEGVQGLETIVGANYLAVLPGPEGGAERRSFVALEEPPIRESIEPGGLHLVLEAPQRFGLAPGAAISFRDFQVGSVLGLSLASDATAVEVEAYIRPDYAALVRENTRFWETGGIEVDFAFTQGLRLDVGSLRSLVSGGIAMATPNDAGAEVEAGHRFRLFADPEKEWLDWRPALPVGRADLVHRTSLPQLARAELAWKSGKILAREHTRSGWLLPVAGGVIGPADLLRPVEDAREGTRLSIEGEVRELANESEPESEGPLAFAPFELAGRTPWSPSRTDFDARAGDWLAVADPTLPPMPISAARLKETDDGFELRESPSFDRSWHGAAVVDRASGALGGVLLVGEKGARIARVPRGLMPPAVDR